MSNFTERYFIDEEKKVVVCKLEYCGTALICDMCKNGWPGDDMLLLPDTFIGKAKCAPGDTFDIEKGKKIAYKRAIAKLNTKKVKVLRRFINLHIEICNELTQEVNKLTKKYDNIVANQVEGIAAIIYDEN